VYKDILLHVDDSPDAAARTGVALAMAARHEAHLTGLFALELDVLPGYVTAQIGEEALRQVRERYQETAAQVRARFEEAAGRAGVAHDWHEARGAATEALCAHARYADMVVVSQSDEDKPGARDPGFPGELALGSGGPVLVVPYVGKHDDCGRRVLVAWNASRESARAVRDALPLLQRAQMVTVVAVNAPDSRNRVPGADIATHLAHHGVEVDVRATSASEIDIGDELLNAISDTSSDLVVMGAYGRSRLREAVFGGATRHILHHMTVPVIMSH